MTDLVLPGEPSDAVPAITAIGDGGVELGVFSMSCRAPTSEEDARYLEWHALDHLPEQLRLRGIRHGARWVSTPECRAARAVGGTAFDGVDHVVCYLLGPPLGPTLDQFFELMLMLRDAGRMAMPLPRVHSGGYRLVRKVAAPRIVAGADVLPWRPARGIYVLVEDLAGDGLDDPGCLDAVVALDGVAGAWRYAGGLPEPGANRPETPPERRITVVYLDAPPLTVAGPLAEALRPRWDQGGVMPLLAAPFEVVVPWEWHRHLP